jgi:hypothetical protein
MKLEEKLEKAIIQEFGTDSISPFTVDGFDMYVKSLTSYNVELFRLAKYHSERQGVGVVSEIHVKKATDAIYKSNDSKALNILNSFSGLLLGASLSHLATLTLNDAAISPGSIAFMLVTALLGAFLLGFYAFR